jgi:hypothetical protein
MRHVSFHKRPRGSSLLFVVIMLAVLAIVGLAVITQANTEADGSAAKRQYDRSLACADAARELLNSQFRLYGVPPTTLQLNVDLDNKKLASGHYDQLNIASVTAATGAISGTLGVSDMSNRIVRTNLGGQLYRISVVCSDSANVARQAEVEFLVRFGL